MKISAKTLRDNDFSDRHVEAWKYVFGINSKESSRITRFRWQSLLYTNITIIGHLWRKFKIRADLSSITITSVGLNNADLSGANISESDLHRSSLNNTLLVDADIRRTYLPLPEFMKNTGVLTALLGPWVVNTTPDKVFVGCVEKDNEGLEEIDMWKDAQRMENEDIADGGRIIRWCLKHRDEVLKMAKMSRDAGWPKIPSEQS